jgi:hypothetical protein
MRLSETFIVGIPGLISVQDIWIDGVHYELGDDGDTLIETPESDEQRSERLRLIDDVER